MQLFCVLGEIGVGGETAMQFDTLAIVYLVLVPTV